MKSELLNELDHELERLGLDVPLCDGLLEKALLQIVPAAESADACRDAIEVAVRLVAMARAFNGRPKPATLKKQLEEYASLLIQVKNVTNRMHGVTRGIVFRGLPTAVAPVDGVEFLRMVDCLIETANFSAEHLVVPIDQRGKAKGSRHLDEVMHAAAFQALGLFKVYVGPDVAAGSKRCLALASILYEAATGVNKTDDKFRHYCNTLAKIDQDLSNSKDFRYTVRGVPFSDVEE